MTLAESPESLVAWIRADHATCTRHRGYALTCEQFDGLLARASGRCELCGLPGADSAWGILHIDHEHQVGKWAVRGLLCDGCNVRLQSSRRLPDTPPLRRYLANAWYRAQLDRLGIDEMPPEPGIGSTVMTGKRTWMRLDAQVERGWANRRGNTGCTFKSWAEIGYEHGPLNLRIVEERTSLGLNADLYTYALGVLRLHKKRHRI